MTPNELNNYFRALADEPDVTFLTVADVHLYLTIGYDQFRQFVSNIDPYIYGTSVDVTVSSTKEVDLTSISTPLLGASAAAGNRMMQLIAVEAVNSSSENTFTFKPLGSIQALNNTRFGVMWQGQKLLFGSNVSETLRITYLPEQNVTWSSTSFFDDLTMFHDMIGLFAYKQYAMRDGGDSAVIQDQLIKLRLSALTEYINSRNLEGASYVARVGGTEEDYGWL